MSQPMSYATIKFPVHLIDKDIIQIMEEDYGVIFTHDDGLVKASRFADIEVEVENDILRLHQEVPGGEYTELEDILMEKEIPFRKYSRKADRKGIAKNGRRKKSCDSQRSFKGKPVKKIINSNRH